MKKGFTLIETLVYIVVLAIIMLVVFSFIFWLSQSATKNKAMREALNNAKRAMEIMTHEIKEAVGIYIPTSIFSTSSGQLSLETLNYLPEGEEKSYVDFFLCQNRLCLKKEGKDPIAITSERVEVRKLEFIQIATTSTVPSIKISLEVDYKSSANKPEYRASVKIISTASLRSY